MDSRINVQLIGGGETCHACHAHGNHPARRAPGLAGVIVTDTGLGDVRGREGFYHYRQYSAIELAESRSFEDVWFLLFYGELPGREAGADFAVRTAGLRRLPEEVREALPAIARAGVVSGLSPASVPPSRCSAPRPDSARSTTSAPTVAARTRSPCPPRSPPC